MVSRLHKEASIQVYFFNHRAPRREHFQGTDIDRYQRIAPHLASAIKLSLKLGETRVRTESVYALLAALRSGVVMLNLSGKILYCNPATELILSRRDAFASDNGSLIALRPSDNQRLQIAITAGLRFAGGEITEKPHPLGLLRKGGEPRYVVTVKPVTSPKDVLSLYLPAVMLIIDDPAYAPRISAGTLPFVFGLTPREVEVATALVAGAGPGKIAQQLMIARATVDSHLRQIYRKTETSGLCQALCVLLQSNLSLI